MSFSYSDDFPWDTAGYHYLRVREGASVLYEEDVAGEESHDTVTLPIAAGTVTFGLEDDLGVYNFGITTHLANFSAPTCGPWTFSSNNAGFTGTYGDVAGWTGMELYPMVYATGTSWHADPPTTAIVSEAVDIALGAYDDGVAEGVITYCLPKSDESDPLYTAVQTRYTAR